MKKTSFVVLIFSIYLFGGLGLAGNNSKVTICHFPPGNTGNPMTITVGANALEAHLAHGDFLGECPNGCLSDITICDDGNLCTFDECLPDGQCAHSVVDCDDSNVCTDDYCDIITGCYSVPTTDPPQIIEIFCSDGVDNNCDGYTDCDDDDCSLDPACQSMCPDQDTDGHPDFNCGGDDCDDNDSAVYPGASEICDGLDNNCDGSIDEGLHVSDPSSSPGTDFTDTFPSNYSVGSYPSQSSGLVTGALSPQGDIDWFYVYAIEDQFDFCLSDDDDAPIVAQVTLTSASNKWYEVCVCWSTGDIPCNIDSAQSLRCVTSEGGTTVTVTAEMIMSCNNTDYGYLDILIKPHNSEIDFSCEYYNVSWYVWEQ